jgi:hypothetical protein
MAKKSASGTEKDEKKALAEEKELRQKGKEAWKRLTLEEKGKMTLEEVSELRHIPVDRFINAGKAPIILPKNPEGTSRGPGRLEPGDYVDGEYYEQILREAKPMGFARMCLVDDKLLDSLAKQKAIRDGDEMEDWQKEAKAKLLEDGEPGMPSSNPVENLRSVMGQQRPHASEEK